MGFTPDSKTAILSHAGMLKYIDTASGKEIRALRAPAQNLVGSLSPDGKYILLYTEYKFDGWLVSAETGAEIRRFYTPGSITGSGFWHDGVSVYFRYEHRAGSEWLGIKQIIIPIDYAQQIAYACTRVTKDFTRDEREQYGITDGEPTCPQFANAMTATPTPTPTPAK